MSRRAAVTLVALGYSIAWLFGVCGALIGVLSADDSKDWAGLGMAIAGFLLGVLLGHVAWLVATVGLLRPFRRTSRIALTVLLTPATIAVVMWSIGELGVPWIVWPVAAAGVPGGLAWWATEPLASGE